MNAICPGYTDTPLVAEAIEAVHRKTRRSAEEVRASITAVNPMGRMIEPAEVASAVLWVAAPPPPPSPAKPVRSPAARSSGR